MINWFVRNSVAANLLMWLIIIFGGIVLFTALQVELFPSSDPETVQITVPLRGATPEDIELGVAVRIEEAVQGIEGIKKITSRSREGSTSTILEIDKGYDARDMLADIKARVDAINTFPAEAEKPVINLQQFNFPVIDVVVSGPLSENEIQYYAEKVREDLLRYDEISQVALRFAKDYEINIEVSQHTLRDHDLQLADVAAAVQQSSLDVSAGNLRTRGGDILIRSRGQAYYRNDFQSIAVKTNADGSILSLGDIATINDGFSEDGLTSAFNGRVSAFIGVSRVGKQSAIKVSNRVKQYIAEQQDNLPVGVQLAYWDDDASYLKSRISTLTRNMLQGGILVVLLLAIFLRPAVAFWVVIGIPISFLGSFMILSALDVSINVMSVFGFIMVLGLVVDDAIVTGESIYAGLQEGREGEAAAIYGTHKVAIPVTFGVLTTMAAFIPLAFVDGFLGRAVAPIPAVVIAVMLFSLIETKFILPAHLKYLKPLSANQQGSRFTRWQYAVAHGFEKLILNRYGPLLDRALKNRYSVLAGFIGVFAIIVALLSSGWVRFTFMPRVPSETVVVSVTMPVGTPFEVTDRHMARIASHASAVKEKYTTAEGAASIRHVMTVTGSHRRGGNGPHRGQVMLELLSPEKRPVPVTSEEITRQLRQLIGAVPGAEAISFRSELFRAGDPVDVQLTGTSFERLAEVTEQVKKKLATYPTIFDIADSYSQGKQELHIELSPEGEVLGLTRSAVLNQVSQAFRGFEAQRIQRGRDDVRVLVRLPRQERARAATLDELLITVPGGQQVPLAHVATLSAAKGPAEITRIDRYRVVNITADFDKSKTNAVVLGNDLQIYLNDLLSNYPEINYTLEGEAREQRDSFSTLGISLLGLLFFMYCLLALPLKSYTKPFIVMSVIPFALIGAVLGHIVMGYPMTMLSYMGLLALVGVVVNDSLVLVDFFNQSIASGKSIDEAVRQAGVKRFRAVILTSLTTFFGLMPMMIVTNTQSLFLVPMAISLGFGILFATAITLLLVPVNLLIARDIRAAWQNLFARGAQLN